jgi:hypothetical protein
LFWLLKSSDQQPKSRTRVSDSGQVDFLASGLGEGGCADLVGCHHVQDGRADALEDHELAGVRASGDGIGQDVAELQVARLGPRIAQRPSVDVL